MWLNRKEKKKYIKGERDKEQRERETHTERYLLYKWVGREEVREGVREGEGDRDRYTHTWRV